MPPQNDSWIYVNLNLKEGPDIVANGEGLPFTAGLFDWVICIEVLEFIVHPEKLISEINRILKPKGKLVLTSPFLYRIHGKPFDLQRFTDEKIKQLLSMHFEIKTLKSQGYFFTVIADFAKCAIAQIKLIALRYAVGLFILPFIPLFRFFDQTRWVHQSDFLTSFTTGYWLIAQKK